MWRYRNYLGLGIFTDGFLVKSGYPHLVTEDIEENVQKMMGCGLFENGYFVYVCTHCGKEKQIAFTCKSRFCLRCAKVYIDNWVNKMKETVFKWIPHRHVILTVPGSLWEYFRSEKMLKMLADCAVAMMKDV
ncbi:MAG: transposase zinc-binding domain-containing protein, partial [Candidatus Hydrothermarchaeota archaeon]